MRGEGGGALSRKAGEGRGEGSLKTRRDGGCRVQGHRRSEEARLPGRGRSGAGCALGTSVL